MTRPEEGPGSKLEYARADPGQMLRLASNCNWPRLVVSGGKVIGQGAQAWHRFKNRATPRDLIQATRRLEARIAKGEASYTEPLFGGSVT